MHLVVRPKEIPHDHGDKTKKQQQDLDHVCMPCGAEKRGGWQEVGFDVGG